MSAQTVPQFSGKRNSILDQKAIPNLAKIEEDVDTIYKAIKGLGTDEDALIRVICHRNEETLMAIRDLYYKKYRRDLSKHIADDTSFNFKHLLVGLTTPRTEYIARELNWTVDGLGTAEGGIIDCIAFLTNEQLTAVKEEFLGRHKRSLEEAISSDTSGYFKRLCLALLLCNRDESTIVNTEQAVIMAEQIYKAGEARWGTDDEFFIEIFTKTSRAQLAEVDKQYMDKYHKSLRKAVSKETSGSFGNGLKAMVISKSEWWVKRFHKSTWGPGTDDRILVRGLVVNSREELAVINELYNRTYDKTLVEAIRADTSGHYRAACLALFDP